MTRLKGMAGKRLTDAGQLHLTCSEHRSQETNRLELFERLRAMIQQARIEPKVRRKTKPSKASKRARYDAKKRRGETKSQRRSVDY